MLKCNILKIITQWKALSTSICSESVFSPGLQQSHGQSTCERGNGRTIGILFDAKPCSVVVLNGGEAEFECVRVRTSWKETRLINVTAGATVTVRGSNTYLRFSSGNGLSRPRPPWHRWPIPTPTGLKRCGRWALRRLVGNTQLWFHVQAQNRASEAATYPSLWTSSRWREPSHQSPHRSVKHEDTWAGVFPTRQRLRAPCCRPERRAPGWRLAERWRSAGRCWGAGCGFWPPAPGRRTGCSWSRGSPWNYLIRLLAHNTDQVRWPAAWRRCRWDDLVLRMVQNWEKGSSGTRGELTRHLFFVQRDTCCSGGWWRGPPRSSLPFPPWLLQAYSS